MDELDPTDLANDPAVAEIVQFMVENMTAAEVKALAFDIGISPEALEGDLVDELAFSLIHNLAQRSDLQHLSRGLRDLFPADYAIEAHEEEE